MELQIIPRGPFQTLDTPHEGWLGAATGLYLHTGHIPWWDTRLPRRWHQCRPHSVGVQGTGYIRHMILRCTCGGSAESDLARGWEPGQMLVWRETRWEQRNSRRKHGITFVTLM